MRQLVWIVFVVCVAIPRAAVAQTVTIDPTTVAFTASADHDVTNVDDTYVVTGYQFDAMSMNTLGALAVSLSLGKPTPQTAGCPLDVPAPCIVLNIASTLITITSNVTYTATVSAVGPGGSGVSAPSNPFARAGTPKVPAAPTAVKVKK